MLKALLSLADIDVDILLMLRDEVSVRFWVRFGLGLGVGVVSMIKALLPLADI
jgi:hypothetical protein